MGFRLGDIVENVESGSINGIQREIACDCWFTSNGRMLPRIIKIMDKEGMIHTIYNIEVLFSEEKFYSGIRTMEHMCRIRIMNEEKLVKLIFTNDICRWTIIFI